MDGATSNEAADIAEQQRVIQSGLGFDIHPDIWTALSGTKSGLRIADISPGTQFHHERDSNPSSSYDKVDFEEIAVPGGLAEGKKGAFDIVAVRLLHTALPNDAWDQAVRNLVSLLRPGGWLQWVDWDPLTARLAGARPGTTDAILRDVLQRFRDDLQARKVGITYRIPNAMKSAGLVDEDSDMYPLNPEVSLSRSVANTAIRSLEKSGALSQEEAKDLIPKLDEEITKDSPLLWYDLWCHIARKP